MGGVKGGDRSVCVHGHMHCVCAWERRTEHTAKKRKKTKRNGTNKKEGNECSLVRDGEMGRSGRGETKGIKMGKDVGIFAVC